MSVTFPEALHGLYVLIVSSFYSYIRNILTLSFSTSCSLVLKDMIPINILFYTHPIYKYLLPENMKHGKVISKMEWNSWNIFKAETLNVKATPSPRSLLAQRNKFNFPKMAWFYCDSWDQEFIFRQNWILFAVSFNYLDFPTYSITPWIKLHPDLVLLHQPCFRNFILVRTSLLFHSFLSDLLGLWFGS